MIVIITAIETETETGIETEIVIEKESVRRGEKMGVEIANAIEGEIELKKVNVGVILVIEAETEVETVDGIAIDRIRK